MKNAITLITVTLLLMSLPAFSTPQPNLVLAGPSSCVGQSVCNARTYEVLAPGLNLAVKGAPNTWKPYAQIKDTESVLVCRASVEPHHYSSCVENGITRTQWVPKSSLGLAKVRTLVWGPSTKYTDGTAIAETLTYRVYGDTGEAVTTSVTRADIFAYGCYQVSAVGAGGESQKVPATPLCISKPVPEPPENPTAQ
jgi:hypothetical protein